MIINAGPQMGYSELVEMYGDELGFSIGKTFRKAKKAVKKTARVIARNPAAIATGGVSLLAPKSVQRALNVGVRAASTGGVSLVATKSGRNLVGSTARVAQRSVLRPVSHVAAKYGRAAARSPIVQKAAGTAFRSFVPGGSAALSALDLTRSLMAKKRKLGGIVQKRIPRPVAIQRSASGQVGQFRSPRPAFTPAVVPESAAASAPRAFPILPVAIGGAGLLLVLALVMGKKK